jgi:hypothetical protein
MSFSQIENGYGSAEQIEQKTPLFYTTQQKHEIIEQIVQLQTVSKGMIFFTGIDHFLVQAVNLLCYPNMVKLKMNIYLELEEKLSKVKEERRRFSDENHLFSQYIENLLESLLKKGIAKEKRAK